MRHRLFALALAASALLAATAAAAAPHNVVIFVADGLRSRAVTEETAPALAAIRREGVDFRNSHSIYPTMTTVNAAAIATGHKPGDTGDFGNTVYLGAPALPSNRGSLVAFIEDDQLLREMNRRFDGDFLGEVTLLQAAAAQGFSAAVVGKHGPAAIQAAADGRQVLIVDDRTGAPSGFALPQDVQADMQAAGLPLSAPGRGANGEAGDFDTPGTTVANLDQQAWFGDVAAKVLLPRFKAAGKPFVLVFWSRDPDGSQHNEGDSLNALVPGVNGATSYAGVRNASDALQKLRDALSALGLAETTDIVVTADHGFSTIDKQSRTSPSARFTYPDVPRGFLPPGFLAVDLARALGLPLREPDGQPIDAAAGGHPRWGAAMLASDPARPQVLIGANGGTDLLWLGKGEARGLARRIVAFVQGQDYAGGIFVRDELGPIPGTLPTSAIELNGSARTPPPDLVIGFRSAATCGDVELCAAQVSDTELQQGQGMHGGFSRADTHNFMAAVGPDFKRGYVDPAPVSNADWAPTLAHVLGLDRAPRGALSGRVMAEALEGGREPKVRRRTVRSDRGAPGLRMMLDVQSVGDWRYYDAAGYPGRVAGLSR